MVLKRAGFPGMTRQAFKEKRNAQKLKDSRNAKRAAAKKAKQPGPGY